jgi:4-hydroxy-tetrahydrodipicolinate synthase
MKEKLFGVYVPMITPLTDDGENLNEPELRALCRFLLQKRVHGLFPVGTTGECAFLSCEERKRVAEVVVDETAGAIPVIIHTGTLTTRESIELTQHAQAIGADAAAVVVPYYYSLDDKEIFAHYEAILNAVPDFPLLAYNIPHNAKNYVTPAIIQSLR